MERAYTKKKKNCFPLNDIAMIILYKAKNQLIYYFINGLFNLFTFMR